MKEAESKHNSVWNACGLAEVVFFFPLMVKTYCVMSQSRAKKHREKKHTGLLNRQFWNQS